MDQRPWVVVADPIDREAVEALRAGPCRVADVSAEPATLERHLPEAWGLVVRARTKVTAELMAKAPKLRLVARAGVGLDNIDLPAAQARGIRVTNVPQAATTSVAELTVAFYLLLVRDLVPSIVSTRAGRWDKKVSGHELAGRTVGFVGFGRIAREVARRVEPFGVKTMAFDPYVKDGTGATKLVGFEELLRSSDIVSVHAALTPENHHLIDARAIASMRAGSFLVNVARGALVDEAAVADALRRGHLGGAALDVFEREPPTDSGLLGDPHVVPTPHVGASTAEAQRRAGTEVVAAVLTALEAEAPAASTPGAP